MPVRRDNQGNWPYYEANQYPGEEIELNEEMQKMKQRRADNRRRRRFSSHAPTIPAPGRSGGLFSRR
jgi:hypothetical protein